MERYFFKAICKNDRYEGISQIETIINKYGFIIDFKIFSDISISMIVEIPKKKVDSLYSELKAYLIMDDFGRLNSDSEKECTLFLNVSFKRGTGDLYTDVPDVPG